jgi:hypothetical protein
MGASATASDRRTLPLGIRIMLVAAFLLAVGATGLVVFADDIRLLRLAAVLALWVALMAAFAIARSRRDTRSAQRRQEEVRLAYMVELHREISARNEYEATLSRQLEAAHADQLDGLRREVDRLASALSRLLDGDVLFERVTLSAESTRVRALAESGQAGGAGGSAAVPALDAMTVVDGTDSGFDPDAVADSVGVRPEPAPVDSAPLLGDIRPKAAGSPPIAVDPRVPSTAAVSGDGQETGRGHRGPEAGQPNGAPVVRDDEHPTMPLPAVRRADAPATDWTWIHRAASPAPAHTPDPVAAPTAPAHLPAPPAAVEADEPAPSSVAIGDLLAAYGLDGGSRRRRRHD